MSVCVRKILLNKLVWVLVTRTINTGANNYRKLVNYTGVGCMRACVHALSGKKLFSFGAGIFISQSCSEYSNVS